MKNPSVWTAKHPDGGWQVKREGASRATSIHDTQAEANKVARGIAINNHCEHKIQGRDGRILNTNSYGHDGCPPRDTK